MDDSGNALSFWSKTGTIASLYATRVVSGAWSSSAPLLSQGLSNNFWAQLDFDAAGNGRMVWSQSGSYAGQGQNGSLNIFTRAFNSGSFGSVGVVENDSLSASGQSPPRIVVDAASNAVAVWVQTFAGNQHVWANRYQAGVGWLGREQIENKPANALWPMLDLDANGNAMVVWMQPSAGQQSLWASRLE